MARPVRKFHDLIGQSRAVSLLQGQCRGARQKQESLPALLIVGSAGCGRRVLARAVAEEMEAQFVAFSVRPDVKVRDLTDWLDGMTDNRVVFFGGLETLSASCQAMLATAIVEDEVGNGNSGGGRCPSNRQATFIASTDSPSKLNSALRKLFLRIELEPYNIRELRAIVERIIKDHCADFTNQAIGVVAGACGGVPSVAEQLVRSIHRAGDGGRVTEQVARDQLELLGIDENGLWRRDRACLSALLAAGEEGLSPGILSVMAGVDPDTIRTEVDPVLLHRQLVSVHGTTRSLTETGVKVAEQILARQGSPRKRETTNNSAAPGISGSEQSMPVRLAVVDQMSVADAPSMRSAERQSS